MCTLYIVPHNGELDTYPVANDFGGGARSTLKMPIAISHLLGGPIMMACQCPTTH